MTKTRFNLVGDTFTHLTGGNKGYSVHGKVSKYIEWNIEWMPGYDTFYIDGAIDNGLTGVGDPNIRITDNVRMNLNPGRKKYGWLLESRAISGSLMDIVLHNIDLYKEVFNTIFVHDKRFFDIDSELFKFVPAQGSWIKDPMKAFRKGTSYTPFDKTKLVSMIASNKDWTSGHLVRLEWVKKLRGRVDLYGRGFNPIEFKEQGLDDYMFSVAIENGQYETYFTEKLLDCFLSCTIPIYSGAPDVGDYFNLDGILRLEDFDSISPELYFSKYEAVCENYERALKMEILEDYIWENYLNG